MTKKIWSARSRSGAADSPPFNDTLASRALTKLNRVLQDLEIKLHEAVAATG